MRSRSARDVAWSLALGLAVVGCGGDGTDEPGAAESEVTEPTLAGAMSVAALCDPLEGVVADWAGAAITPQHNPIYADAADPILVCEWAVDGVDRSIRVDYVGVPDSFFLGLVEGRQDRADVVAPNAQDGSRFYVLAPNGWGVVVDNRGADRSEELDPLVEIAQVALAQVPS